MGAMGCDSMSTNQPTNQPTQLIASLIWLQGLNSKEPITMYFNVPGAISKPALAVYDTMRRMSCPLHTVNIGDPPL